MVYRYLFPICYLEHIDSLRLRHGLSCMQKQVKPYNIVTTLQADIKVP